jgi:hypothetical protein
MMLSIRRKIGWDKSNTVPTAKIVTFGLSKNGLQITRGSAPSTKRDTETSKVLRISDYA